MEILIIVILVAILIYGLTDKREKKTWKIGYCPCSKAGSKR